MSHWWVFFQINFESWQHFQQFKKQQTFWDLLKPLSTVANKQKFTQRALNAKVLPKETAWVVFENTRISIFGDRSWDDWTERFWTRLRSLNLSKFENRDKFSKFLNFLCPEFSKTCSQTLSVFSRSKLQVLLPKTSRFYE